MGAAPEPARKAATVPEWVLCWALSRDKALEKAGERKGTYAQTGEVFGLEGPGFGERAGWQDCCGGAGAPRWEEMEEEFLGVVGLV